MVLYPFIPVSTVLSSLNTLVYTLPVIKWYVHKQVPLQPNVTHLKADAPRKSKETLSVLVGNWRPYTVQANFVIVKGSDSRDPSAVELLVMGYF